MIMSSSCFARHSLTYRMYRVPFLCLCPRTEPQVCSRAVAVQSFVTADAMKGKRATAELAAATALCKEAETEAEQTLRPFVSSAETFKWSVNLISTEKVSLFTRRGAHPDAWRKEGVARGLGSNPGVRSPRLFGVGISVGRCRLT